MNAHWRRLLALATAIAFAASLGLPFVSPQHAWVNDPDAEWSLPLVSAHPGAHFQAGSARPAPEHCAICHWMRALGSSLVGTQPLGPGLTLTLAGRIDPESDVAPTLADAGSPRGPPSSLA